MPSDFGLDEWKSAREDFAKYDDRQHDLRKYGFTFLAALIAADSLTKIVNFSDDLIPLVIMTITLVIIVALSYLDKYYELIKTLTSIRTRIIEQRLNLELVEDIIHRTEYEQLDKFVLFIYSGFVLVTVTIGTIILRSTNMFILFSFLIFAFVVFALLLKIYTLRLNLNNSLDWSFDRTICTAGECLRIIATNLCNHSISIPEGKLIWELHREGENSILKFAKASSTIKIGSFNNFSWQLTTQDISPGIYRLYPYHITKSGSRWTYPLKRAIIITKPE